MQLPLCFISQCWRRLWPEVAVISHFSFNWPISSRILKCAGRTPQYWGKGVRLVITTNQALVLKLQIASCSIIYLIINLIQAQLISFTKNFFLCISREVNITVNFLVPVGYKWSLILTRHRDKSGPAGTRSRQLPEVKGYKKRFSLKWSFHHFINPVRTMLYQPYVSMVAHVQCARVIG